MIDDEPRYDPWIDAQLAAALLAVDPSGLGGACLRGWSGPPRDHWQEHFCSLLPAGAPSLRMPLHITPDRLIGGLDLTATLASGTPVVESGLLARVNDGVIIVAMAERLDTSTAALISGAMDTGQIRLERDGTTRVFPSSFALVALDEGLEPDERPPDALLDRLAFHIDLAPFRTVEANPFAMDRDRIAEAAALLRSVRTPPDIQAALCGAADALGVESIRAVLFALRTARAAAALAGETETSEADAALAARLVLAPRATRLPTNSDDQDQSEQAPEPEQENEAPETQQADQTPEGDPENDAGNQTPNDVVLESAQAAIPENLLEMLQLGSQRRTAPRSSGKSGEKAKARARGRPVGTRAGKPEPSKPLNVIATLRAAAPWQRLRGSPLDAVDPADRRVAVRGDDFRTTRFKQRAETVTIFLVDASGSAAMQRLAEAKGAVELLLADCYVRRDQVALIAFRGQEAELLLPPTRSLVRAKRSLAGLPGGGGTPLATALDAAGELVDQVRRRGQTPLVVALTDGRANIGRDGEPGRAKAHADAMAAALALRLASVPVIIIDTSARPHRLAQEIATAMDARYLPLPFADARGLSSMVKQHSQAVGAA